MGHGNGKLVRELIQEKAANQAELVQLRSQLNARPEALVKQLENLKQQIHEAKSQLKQQIHEANSLLKQQSQNHKDAEQALKTLKTQIKQHKRCLQELTDQEVYLTSREGFTQTQLLKHLANQSTSFTQLVAAVKPEVLCYLTRTCVQRDRDYYDQPYRAEYECPLCSATWTSDWFEYPGQLSDTRSQHLNKCQYVVKLWRDRQVEQPNYRTLFLKLRKQVALERQRSQQKPPEYDDLAPPSKAPNAPPHSQKIVKA